MSFSVYYDLSDHRASKTRLYLRVMSTPYGEKKTKGKNEKKKAVTDFTGVAN